MISSFDILNNSWPAAPEGQRHLPIDASRALLAEHIEKLVAEVRTRYADKTRTTEFKRAGSLPYVEHLQKALQGYHADAVKTARDTQAGIESEISKKLPTPKYDGREVRDAIAANPEKRYLKVERAIDEGDAEVLMHVANTPWVRDDIAPAEQIGRARAKLWEIVAPARAAEHQRIEELIPHHQRLVEAAEAFVGSLRMELGDEAKVADRLSGAEMARQAQSAARAILGIAEPTVE